MFTYVTLNVLATNDREYPDPQVRNDALTLFVNTWNSTHPEAPGHNGYKPCLTAEEIAVDIAAQLESNYFRWDSDQMKANLAYVSRVFPDCVLELLINHADDWDSRTTIAAHNGLLAAETNEPTYPEIPWENLGLPNPHHPLPNVYIVDTCDGVSVYSDSNIITHKLSTEFNDPESLAAAFAYYGNGPIDTDDMDFSQAFATYNSVLTEMVKQGLLRLTPHNEIRFPETSTPGFEAADHIFNLIRSFVITRSSTKQ